MTGNILAEILEQSAAGYAATAASRLLQQHPDVKERFAPNPVTAWRKHLTQRVLELSAAVATQQPDMFVARVIWSRQALIARGLHDHDVSASLNSLREVLSESLPENAGNVAVVYMDQALAALDLPPRAIEGALDPGQKSQRLALEYLQAVLEGNLRPAMAIVLDAIDDGLTARDALLKVLLPAQREIGRLWHQSQVSIAEEHLVTSTTLRLMTVLVEQGPHKPANGKTVIAAAVAGNAHDVGIRATAYLFELEGWRTIYLGPDLPAADFVASVRFFDADLVLLSTALSVQLKALKHSIAAIRDHAGREVNVIVGGQVFVDAPDAWRAVGADGYAVDADDALRLAELL